MGGGGGLDAFHWYQIVALDFVVGGDTQSLVNDIHKRSCFDSNRHVPVCDCYSIFHSHYL